MKNSINVCENEKSLESLKTIKTIGNHQGSIRARLREGGPGRPARHPTRGGGGLWTGGRLWTVVMAVICDLWAWSWMACDGWLSWRCDGCHGWFVMTL